MNAEHRLLNIIPSTQIWHDSKVEKNESKIPRSGISTKSHPMVKLGWKCWAIYYFLHYDYDIMTSFAQRTTVILISGNAADEFMQIKCDTKTEIIFRFDSSSTSMIIDIPMRWILCLNTDLDYSMIIQEKYADYLLDSLFSNLSFYIKLTDYYINDY